MQGGYLNIPPVKCESMGRRAKPNGWMILGIVALLLLGFAIFTGKLQFSVTERDRFVVSGCEYSPKLEFVALNKYTGAEESGLTVYYRVAGEKSWRTTTTGSQVDVNPGDVIEFKVAPDSNSYYGAEDSVKIECKPVIRAEVEVEPIASSVQFIAWNDDGTPNSNSNEQVLGAGEIKTLEFKLTGEYKKAYGKPGKMNVIVVAYNKTEIDDVKIQGTGVSATNLPQQLDTATGMGYKAYLIPALDSNEKKEYKLVIDTDDTINPANDITIYIYDVQLFANEDKVPTEFEWGVEDEDNADVGGSNLSFTVYAE